MDDALRKTLLKNGQRRHNKPAQDSDFLDPIVFTAGMVRAGIWIALAASLSLNAALLIDRNRSAQEDRTRSRSAAAAAERCKAVMGQGENHERKEQQPPGGASQTGMGHHPEDDGGSDQVR